VSDASLLLHGFTGSPASFDAVVALLPAGARVIRPFLSGHGSDPARSASWEAELDRIFALIDDAGVERAHVCGYSLGGRLAWGLLARDPSRFSGATLVGAHPGLADDVERAARSRADARWIEMLERDGLDAFLDAWQALPFFATQSADQIAKQRAIRVGHRARDLAHAIRTLGLAEMPAVDPARIATPVTLVVGEHDAAHRAIAEQVARRLPDGRLVIADGAGHNVLLERPDVVAVSCSPRAGSS
jgi:2-succinyl-6-hydroxy-2,4-cyclohexadiene-1-carboxylate synthase